MIKKEITNKTGKKRNKPANPIKMEWTKYI